MTTPNEVKALCERLRAALALLPVECHDTPDYAEATGPQFQAMTMTPDAFLALNALPDLLALIESLSARNAEMVEWALDKSAVHHRLAHENEHLRKEHIASSSAYRELAEELEARAALDTPSKQLGEG